jgi:hypothetical protein
MIYINIRRMCIILNEMRPNRTMMQGHNNAHNNPIRAQLSNTDMSRINASLLLFVPSYDVVPRMLQVAK